MKKMGKRDTNLMETLAILAVTMRIMNSYYEKWINSILSDR